MATPIGRKQTAGTSAKWSSHRQNSKLGLAMKTLFTSVLLLTLAIGGNAAIVSPCWAQQHEVFRTAASSEALGSHVVGTFSPDGHPQVSVAPEANIITPPYQAEHVDHQNHQDNVITDDHLFPEVKNVNFFGVDRNQCCDEWAGLCDSKSPKYRCNCGGLKANKGHLGIPWLKRKYGGDGCDYCNGGRCEKKRHCKKKRHDNKGGHKKFSSKDRSEETVDSSDEPSQNSIFGRPLETDCHRCGRCDQGCSAQDECQSCK